MARIRVNPDVNREVRRIDRWFRENIYYLYDPPPRDEVLIVRVWSPRRGTPPPL
jgi:hypothetical protein